MLSAHWRIAQRDRPRPAVVLTFKHRALLHRHHGIQAIRHARAGHDAARIIRLSGRAIACGLLGLHRQHSALGKTLLPTQREAVHR